MTLESASTLSAIHVYPVKSMMKITQTQAWVEQQGLAFDRCFMLTTLSGTMITARQHPRLFQVSVSLMPDGIVIQHPSQPSLTLRYRDFSLDQVESAVWSDAFSGSTTTIAANEWFSGLLDTPVQLLYAGEKSTRTHSELDQNVSLADDYPLLLISEASLVALNDRCTQPQTMDQFRPNLVVTGTEPFAEDGWKRIKIGEVEFEVRKACGRCILTTLDPETGATKTDEPLSVLAKFRADGSGDVIFGQFLVPMNEGKIALDDKVQILETKDPVVYPDDSVTTVSESKTDKLDLRCVKRETIAQDFETFWFESDNTTDLPTFLAGQYLPLSVVIDGKIATRSYTLSSHPSLVHRYGVSVKRVDNGVVSNWMLDSLMVGDVVSAQSPDGDFYLEKEMKDPLLLLSAGSGVTPMLAMIKEMVAQDRVNDVVFYHQCRTELDIPCQQILARLVEDHPSLTVKIALTQPSDEWKGAEGRITQADLADIDNLAQRHVFVCGPDGFMKNAKLALLALGVPESAYHQESFGVGVMENDLEVESLEITVNEQNFIGNNQETLLQQAEKKGIVIKSACRAGLCGQCKVSLLSGRVNQKESVALSVEDRLAGKVLACCCTPLTDIQIQAE